MVRKYRHYWDGGMSYFHGLGVFAQPLEIPQPGGTSSGKLFSNQSNTKYQFFAAPVTVGLDYRFNLFRFLRPYIIAGPTVVGYVEMRNDATPGSHGHSEGFLVAAGASLLLDWMSSEGSWDLTPASESNTTTSP